MLLGGPRTTFAECLPVSAPRGYPSRRRTGDAASLSGRAGAGTLDIGKKSATFGESHLGAENLKLLNSSSFYFLLLNFFSSFLIFLPPSSR